MKLRLFIVLSFFVFTISCGDNRGGGDDLVDGVDDIEVMDPSLDESIDYRDSLDFTDNEIEVTRECEDRFGDKNLIVLRGSIVTPLDIIYDGEVAFQRDTGKIICVAEDCLSEYLMLNPTVICTNGIIYPGLIDTHNHLTYNHLPRWRHQGRYFHDRYEWRNDSDYRRFREANTDIRNSRECEIVKYAEVRLLMGGVTSSQGSAGSRDCISLLIRNLDAGGIANGLGEDTIYNFTAGVSVADMTQSDLLFAIDGLRSGRLKSWSIHLAEGRNYSSRDEFRILKERGLMINGVNIIHGTAAKTPDFVDMVTHGVDLIWSPYSNIDLYGVTSRIPIALHLGVKVALAPDWTPSGGFNILQELRCAKYVSEVYWNGELSDEELVKMVTIYPAEILAISDKLGKLDVGYFADITVIKGNRSTPYSSLINAREKDVMLVIVGGVPLYGDTEFMSYIEPPYCEDIEVCGVNKRICVKSDLNVSYADEELSQIVELLETALNENRPSPDAYMYDLYPLYQCEEDPVGMCNMGNESVSGVPKAGDMDGDDIDDTVDNCPTMFDPSQEDLDQDGLGDICDLCPLDPNNRLPCVSLNPDDIDGDGIEDSLDNCPRDYNPNQEPVCQGVLVTVYQIQNPNEPGHVSEGTLVRVENVIVTAVSSRGFWVQERGGGPWSGVYVYVGSNFDPTSIEVGQEVRVVGTIEEYYGRTEISGRVNYTITNRNLTPILPEYIADPTTVATGGRESEAYEGVFIEVRDIYVVNSNPDAPQDYNEFVVNTVQGSTSGLRVDDYLYRIPEEYCELGDRFRFIRGILDYSYSNYKLEPRGRDDFEPLP